MKRIFIALVLWSVVLTAPQLARTGVNVVTNTYRFAVDDLTAARSPYVVPAHAEADVYKYAPGFVALYAPFAALPSSAQAVAWMIFNVVLFWGGFVALFRLRWGARPAWQWVALGLASMELDGSLRYQQVNAAFIGVLMYSLAALRNRRMATAASLATIATLFKVISAPLWLVMAVKSTRRFLTWTLVALAAGLALPYLFAGGRELGASLYTDWFSILWNDSSARGLLDIRMVFLRWGWPLFGEVVRGLVVVVTIAAVVRSFRTWPNAADDERAGALWSMLLTAILLFSPRTESPTFVLLAPVFVWSARAAWAGARWQRAAWTLSIFLTTIAYNDIWPKMLWNPAAQNYASKPLGTLILWGLSLARLVH